MAVAPSNSPGFFPYLFALLLSGGSLLTYLIGAIVSRFTLMKEGRNAASFNLGIPATQTPETLFAVSLAAAQTTFSTVFVVFLTGAGTLGLHLLYCPIAFALGNWLMLVVYKRVELRGYVDQSSTSGVVPYLVYKLTHSRFISYCALGMCVLPIVAVLALELHYGISVLDRLVQKAFPMAILQGQSAAPSKGLLFGIFTCFMIFLFGYVFIGGFRAVVISDVWQYRIMLTTLTLATLSVLWLAASHHHDLRWDKLGQSPGNLVAFYVAVTIIDLFQPLCFATTWQRFRAFRDQPTDFTVAIRRATARVTYLWVMLIVIGVCLQLISPATSDLPHFLDRVVGLNVWFSLFVFPLLVLAGFSGMYSSSDTCVSALLYLTETSRAWHEAPFESGAPLRKHYYWVMASVFLLTFIMYGFVEGTTVDPAWIAIAVFGNSVILAPTVLLLTALDPVTQNAQYRSVCIGASIILGLIVYWCVAAIDVYWAVVAGLLSSAMPAYLLWLRERRNMKEKQDV